MDADEYAQWKILSEVEAAEREGEEPEEPTRKVISDPAEIAKWFAARG